MKRPMHRSVAWLAALSCVVALAACPRSVEPEAKPPRAAPTIEKKTVPLKKLDGDKDDKEDTPVYAPDAKPLPIAEKLCRALYDLREMRKASCCEGTPRPSPITPRCVSSLSAALAGDALKVDEAAVDRCAAAVDERFQGCDWVRTIPHPRPRACDKLFEGTLGEGAACRSSLECREGLSCAGAGPMDAGRCLEPRPAGAPCHTAVDPLAGYVGDEEHARRHPQCAGYCALRRCADHKPIGGACKRTEECGRDAHCANGKCVAGAFAALGAPCSGGGCEPGARCVAGTCVSPKPKGAACRFDQECEAACVKPKGSSEGVCNPRCHLEL